MKKIRTHSRAPDEKLDSHRKNVVLAPNLAPIFCRKSFHEKYIFLTDGQRTVRYCDLTHILHTAHYNYRKETDSGGDTNNHFTSQIAAIDTGHRFTAVLWMVYCWVRAIPFVPFCSDHREPLDEFQPSVIIFTSTETENSIAADQASACVLKSAVSDILGRTASEAEKPDRYRAPNGTSSDETYTNETDNFFALERLIPFTDHPDSIFCGLLTSGSSGRPKRVALLRRNMIAAAKNAFRDIGATSSGCDSDEDVSDENVSDETISDKTISGNTVLSEKKSISRAHFWGNCLPLHHAGGLTIIFRALLSGTGIFLWNRFDTGIIIGDVFKYPEIRRISLVPTMLKRLLACMADSGKAPPLTLQQVLVGGGPASQELILRARKSGWPVSFSYGMTETCGQIASQKTDGSSPPASVGQPFVDHAIAIRDDNDEEAPAGTVGSLWVRGPQVFPGYLPETLPLSDFSRMLQCQQQRYHHFHHPDSKSTVRKWNRDEWFNTGDYGRIDNQGNLYIELRRSDLIISGGKNVNPSEVESVLQKSPDIAEAAVTGLADEEWGQIVVTLVVLHPADQSGRDVSGHRNWHSEVTNRIHSFISQNLKPHQRPKKIGFTDSLPRTSLGKLDRKKLQDMATDQLFGK